MYALPFTKICDFAIEALIYFLVIFTPLVYGSVQILPLTILESTCFLALLLWLVKISVSDEVYFIKSCLWLPIIVFFSLAALQLIPLPKQLLAVLSPHQYFLINKFIPPEAMNKAVFSLSVYRNQTLGKLIELLSYAAAFFVLVNNINSQKQVKRILLIVISMGLVVSILEVANKFKFPFVNRNHFAGYVVMIIPLAIGFLLTEIARPKKIILGFSAAIMLTALFLSLSRAGILCLLGALIFMFFLLKLRRTLRAKTGAIYILLVIAFILILVMGIEPVLERFSGLFLKEQFSAEGRWIIWKDTLKIISDFPLFGVGIGAFRNIYPMYKTLPAQAIVNYAHSDFLQLTSEGGMAGLVVAIWFLILFFKDIFSNWFMRHHPFTKGVTLGGMTGLLAILLHSFFDFNLQIPANALLFTVVMALTYKSVITNFGEDGVS